MKKLAAAAKQPHSSSCRTTMALPMWESGLCRKWAMALLVCNSLLDQALASLLQCQHALCDCHNQMHTRLEFMSFQYSTYEAGQCHCILRASHNNGLLCHQICKSQGKLPLHRSCLVQQYGNVDHMKAAGAGLGAKGQGIAAPVQPVSLDGNSGLGFQFPPPMFDRRPVLRRRSSPPRRCQAAG